MVSIICFENQFLFLRRARDPGAGKLDMPGGFVDFGETAEEALRRELREELMIESVELTYFTSAPNHYLYLNVPYQTLDFYFAATIFTKPNSFDTSEIMEICWRSAGEIVENVTQTVSSLHQHLPCSKFQSCSKGKSSKQNFISS